MATEELSNPSSLPPYPQMIMEAIDALKEAEKSNISKYMESKYGELPSTHADLLTHHLSAMKDSGELMLKDNNYLRPSSDVPLKRGRGRPPKAKEPLPAAGPAVVAPSRGRGRPKKDPNAPPAPKKAKTASAAPPSGRPRGRPRKVQPQALQNGVEA